MDIEAKAKEYARELTLNSDVITVREIMNIREESFTAGYTQAVTDLNAENEKLKIALKESIALICSGTEYEVEIERYREFVEKAKQLITA